jgi:hypothetical protein
VRTIGDEVRFQVALFEILVSTCIISKSKAYVIAAGMDPKVGSSGNSTTQEPQQIETIKQQFKGRMELKVFVEAGGNEVEEG